MPELPFKKSVIDVARTGKSTASLPRSLGIEEWSATDQLAWKEAIRPAVRLQRGGAAAHLAKVSQNDIANRYGLYLDFLRRNGLFDDLDYGWLSEIEKDLASLSGGFDL